MKAKACAKTIRRSIALSCQLLEEVSTVAPPELRHNVNRLITVALQEFAGRRKAYAFEEAMARMAADPAIQAECQSIAREFVTAEADGLKL